MYTNISRLSIIRRNAAKRTSREATNKREKLSILSARFLDCFASTDYRRETKETNHRQDVCALHMYMLQTALDVDLPKVHRTQNPSQAAFPMLHIVLGLLHHQTKITSQFGRLLQQLSWQVNTMLLHQKKKKKFDYEKLLQTWSKVDRTKFTHFGSLAMC